MKSHQISQPPCKSEKHEVVDQHETLKKFAIANFLRVSCWSTTSCFSLLHGGWLIWCDFIQICLFHRNPILSATTSLPGYCCWWSTLEFFWPWICIGRAGFRRTGARLPICSGVPARSEERRVGKECRSRWSP